MGKPATKTCMIVVRKPVGINCDGKRPTVVDALASAIGGTEKCRGTMMRVDLSRLEESLGHEGFECGVCHRRVKYVPKG